jgi:glycosyltransferase involved in cell wall biosynthesis
MIRHGGKRIAFGYDLCSPYTVGGAESHYRDLAAELVRRGNSVDYLTSRYWPGGAEQVIDGVRVRAVTRRRGAPTGERSVRAAVSYAVGLALHLYRNGGSYDVVEVAALPPTSALAAWLGLLRHRGTLLVVDWHEVWRLETWRQQFGPLGVAGWVTELLARRVGRRVTFSQMHATRLPANTTVVTEFVGVEPQFKGAMSGNSNGSLVSKHVLLCIGRLVPDKRFDQLPATLAELKRLNPKQRWTAVVVGSGPQRPVIEAEARRLHVLSDITFEQGVSNSRLSDLFDSATVLFHPSRREGFGIVVLEASAHQLPVVLVRAEDNAAVELVANGVNGEVAHSSDPAELARLISQVAANANSKANAAQWWAANSARFTLSRSADQHQRLWASSN